MAAPSSTAPGRLEIVRRFVNTRDVEASTDGLATPRALRQWLGQAQLVNHASDTDSEDLQRALALREALRAAMAANHTDDPMPAEVVSVLNEAAQRAGLVLTFTADSRWTARPRTDGVDGALGELLVLLGAAMSDGSWRRMKVCVNDDCQWAFYDHSRARAGKWCSMQLCGNRAKQQAWRARHERTTV